MKHLKTFENIISALINKMDNIYNFVKDIYPEYDWINPKDYLIDGDWWNVVENEDDWSIDLEQILEFEKEGKVVDANVKPEVEIYFQSEEEMDCYVYTDKIGNIRCLFLNID